MSRTQFSGRLHSSRPIALLLEMNTFHVSASSLQHQHGFHIDGYPLAISESSTDLRGRQHEQPQIFGRNQRWHYGGNGHRLDNFDTDLPQYRSYRDTVVNENDEDELMNSPLALESDVDMLCDEPLAPSTKSGSATSPRSRSDKYIKADIPKLRDIALDSIQIKSVVQHPNTIPRDFHYPADRHYKELASKYGLLERLPAPARKRKFFGFDAQELLLNGALHCTPCRPSDLKYKPTLTIFREETFQDTPQSVLDALKPALALAELVMLKGNPKFWVDVACGMRVPDYERIQKEATRAEKLIPVSQVTQAMMNKTLARLQALGKRLMIRFETLDNVYGCCWHPIVLPVQRPLSGYLNHGQLWPSSETLRLPAPYPGDPWNQPAVIKLDSKLFAAAKRFSMQKFPDMAAKLRFTFFFAVNLLHELAHAFEAKCGHSHYYELISKDRGKPGGLSRSYFSRFVEPKYKHHHTEMGAAFEYETFGGRVHPINHDFSMNYGLNVYLGGGKGHASGAGVQAIRNGQPFGRAIPMGYVEELQQQSYWSKGPKQKGVLIPMCGPKTYLMHSTSTKDWREHLLEHDDAYGVEMLEQVFDEQTHISKRVKIHPPTPKPSTDSAHGKRRRRLLQTKLRKYPKKADAAAAQIKADLIAQATREEAERKAHDPQNTEQPQIYQPPSPTQPAIDEIFHYVNAEDQSQCQPQPFEDPRLDPTSHLYDPLLKLPHELTISDKWLLLEDYAILAHGWSSSTFLAKRAASLTSASNAVPLPRGRTGGLDPIPANMLPSNDVENWGEIHCGMLRVLRERNPGRGLLVERAKRERGREGVKEKWKIRGEMEELVVRRGGSRVEWMRGMVKLEEIGLDDMDDIDVGVDGRKWEEGGWRGMLEELRKEEEAEVKRGSAKVEGEMEGEVDTAAADEFEAEAEAETTGDLAQQVQVQAQVKMQGNKITKCLLRKNEGVLDAEDGVIGAGGDDVAT